MVLCIVALLVFAVLSIWSAKYRGLAKEAFRCVTRMIALKPCDVHLETKIKAKVTAKLMIVPVLARFFYKYFKAISWAFTISFFASLAYSAYSIYNLLFFGSCDPGAPCAITDIGGLCVLVIEQYIAYAIVIVLVIAVAYFLLQKQKNSK